VSRPMADNSKHEDGPCRGEAPRPGRRIHVARLDARGRRQLDDPGGAAYRRVCLCNPIVSKVRGPPRSHPASF